MNIFIPEDIKHIKFENAMVDQRRNSNKYYYVSDKLFIDAVNRSVHSPFIDHIFEAIVNSDYWKEFRIPISIIWLVLDFHGDHIIIDKLVNLLNNTEFHNDALKIDYSGSSKDYENGICIIFSHRYSGKFLNPQMLKGADLYLYNVFKQYFGIYLTPITIKSFIGVWTDEWHQWGDLEDHEEGEIIARWTENDNRTIWNIILGKDNSRWRYPKKLGEKISEFFSRLLLLYSIDKNEVLNQPKFVNGGEEYYGNVGSYDLENTYHCFGMVLTKSDNYNDIIIEMDIM